MSVSSRSGVWLRTAIIAAVMGWGLAGARDAAAQAPPTFSLDPLDVGDCRVVVKITNPRGGDQVGIIVDQTLIREQTVVAGGGTLTFALSDPLRVGSTVRVRVNGSNNVNAGAVSELMTKVADRPGGRAPGECAPEDEPDDESPFLASFFLGEVVDNFAPDKVANYKSKDPDEALKAKGGFIFGFDFDYRLRGRSDSRVQFWVEGETMHGVRTADVDCAPPDPAQRPPVCDESPANIQDRARYILKNATSLEVWTSPRVEFHTLQGGTDSPAKLYTALTLGFIALDDAPQTGVYRSHHVSLGLAADGGSFDGSYLEVGWGKNELFSREWNRLKIAGLLSFSMDRLPIWRDTGRLFVEMTIDNSLSDGPDSIRTFFGVDIDLKKASQ
jgi:hypothetical protein